MRTYTPLASLQAATLLMISTSAWAAEHESIERAD